MGSGAAGVQRIDGEGHGCPRLEMTAMTMKQGLLASCSSIGRTRRLLLFFWTRRKGEGGPVAAVVLVGGGGCVRWLRARELEEERSSERE